MSFEGILSMSPKNQDSREVYIYFNRDKLLQKSMCKGGKRGLGITVLLPFISTLAAGLNLTYLWKSKKNRPAPTSPFTSAEVVSLNISDSIYLRE